MFESATDANLRIAVAAEIAPLGIDSPPRGLLSSATSEVAVSCEESNVSQKPTGLREEGTWPQEDEHEPSKHRYKPESHKHSDRSATQLPSVHWIGASRGHPLKGLHPSDWLFLQVPSGHNNAVSQGALESHSVSADTQPFQHRFGRELGQAGTSGHVFPVQSPFQQEQPVKVH